MTGAIINASGIALGGIIALVFKKGVPASRQPALKNGMGILMVWFGLKLTYSNLNGSIGQISKQLGIVLLAMFLGRIIGRLLRLQKWSNAVGQYASKKLSDARHENKFDDGFIVATALFCIGPLAVLGSVQEGLNESSPVLWIKAVMDCLATISFCSALGWGAVVSAIPVLAFEGALIRAASLLEPTLGQHSQMINVTMAVDGLLIFCVAMIILDLKRIEVTDYLPSLAIAPLLVKWLG